MCYPRVRWERRGRIKRHAAEFERRLRASRETLPVDRQSAAAGAEVEDRADEIAELRRQLAEQSKKGQA